MASISNDRDGRKRILFVDGDGNRKAVRIGKTSMRQAEAVKVRIEKLTTSRITGHSPDDDTARWLIGLDSRLYDRLAAVGLVEPRQSMTLGAWLETYLDGRKTELKPKSLKKLQDTKDALIEYFNPSTHLRKLTPQQASDWRARLEQKLSVASVKTHSGNAKTMMAEAVRRKIIHENPFIHLRSGSTPSKYTRYVTPDEIGKIIEACPNAEWRLLFGLARYAGLRIPSESHNLTWSDVDWHKARLTVRSPKTEHYSGHEQRTVPIMPKLMVLLQARFDECPEGTTKIVAIRGGHILRQVRRISARASVALWDRLWQTLRASCEKQWAMTYPQYAVSRWIGHSITVSGKHYANAVPDELFDKASGTSDQAAQNQAQLAAELNRTIPQAEKQNPQETQETAFSSSYTQEERVSDGTRTRDP